MIRNQMIQPRTSQGAIKLVKREAKRVRPSLYLVREMCTLEWKGIMPLPVWCPPYRIPGRRVHIAALPPGLRGCLQARFYVTGSDNPSPHFLIYLSSLLDDRGKVDQYSITTRCF